MISIVGRRSKPRTDKRMALARVYEDRHGKRSNVVMYFPDPQAAFKSFALYSTLPGTLYACLFSPVDKRGVRTQLKRYVYRSEGFLTVCAMRDPRILPYWARQGSGP